MGIVWALLGVDILSVRRKIPDIIGIDWRRMIDTEDENDVRFNLHDDATQKVTAVYAYS